MNRPFRRTAYFIFLLVAAAVLLQPKGGTWAWLNNIRWLYVFVLALTLAQILTPFSIRLAHRFNILDYPGGRKIHREPIARLGGLAVFLAIIITALRNFQFSPQLTGLLVGSTLIYVTGLIDDIRPVSATFRLLIQAVACLIVVKSGVIISIVPVGVPGKLIFDATITAFWLIGIANALNFLDGVDGLAAGMAALSSLLFFFIAVQTGQMHLAYLSIAITGACAGFLPFNWRPAGVFLGDAGATFLGFFIAGLGVMGTWAYADPLVALSTPLLILGVPIFDMIYITVSRIRNGYVRNFKDWVEYAARDHFHHRLMFLGLTEVQTVFFILMVNFCLGLAALVIRDTGPLGSILLLLQSVFIFLIIVILMVLGKNVIEHNNADKNNSSRGVQP